MKTLTWDSGARWDDPNARWGDPSSLLEPGDPGFVHTGLAPASPTPSKNRTTMSASNETPRIAKVLTALAHDFADGLTTLQAGIGMHHHTATTVRAAMAKLEGDPAAAPGSNANKGSQLVYKDCQDRINSANATMLTVSDGAVKTLLTAYRKVMEGVHGASFNAGWEAAGFTGASTAVPRSHGDRLALLAAMRAYLTAHAANEVSLPQPGGVPLAVTAAAALARHSALSDARQAVNTAQADAALCKGMRDADLDALFDEVSGGIAEVRDLLPADDARWEGLGLNIPANPSPPVAVATFTLVSAGPGKALASWAHARRATHYRVFKKVVGVDADFVQAGSAKDLEFILKDLTAGQTLQVKVLASNDAGDAPPSAVLSLVVVG
jgi:hypothetical protein